MSPLQRNDFVSQNLTTVYTSQSQMTDRVTGLPYNAGGSYLGIYMDLTEAEAQAYSTSLHAGRYRFVQIDSGATASNIKTGTIGLMVAGKQPQLNVVTSYDKGIVGAHVVIFLATVTAAQVTAGAFVFVQELGIASVLAGATVQKAAPATGDLVDSTTLGVLNDLTAQAYAATSIGLALSPPSPNTLCLVQLDLPALQG